MSSPIPRVGRAVAALAIGVPLLLAFAVVSPAQARRTPKVPSPGAKKYESCGVLKASPPWENFIDGVRGERGDHWIVSQRRNGASCAAARAFSSAAIADEAFFAKRSPQNLNLGRFRGSLCLWQLGSGHESIAPFQHITCDIPGRVGRRKVTIEMRVQVDPDPRFITPGPAR